MTMQRTTGSRREDAKREAEARDAAIIAAARGFKVNFFIGGGQYIRAMTYNIEDARAVARGLEATHKHGRKAQIYAIDKDSAAALVSG